MPFKQMEIREQRVEFVVRALGGREPFSCYAVSLASRGRLVIYGWRVIVRAA